MTEINGSLLAPISSAVSTEEQAVPLGYPDPSRNGDLRSYQFDAEHYFGKGSLLKVFAFHNSGRGVTYDFGRLTNSYLSPAALAAILGATYDFSGIADPSDVNLDGTLLPSSITFDRIKRKGLGMRFETQLRRGLFAQMGAVLNRTVAQSTLADFQTVSNVPAPFNGQRAPYHTPVLGFLGFNYVSQSGLKAGVTLSYSGAYFADVFDPTATVRPRIGSSTTVDLLLAREPSVRGELFLKVINAFDKRQFAFNDIPLTGRRIVIGVQRRF